MLHQFIVALLTALGRAKLRAACRLQDRTSTLDDVADILSLEFFNLIQEQTFITTVYTLHFYPVVNSGTGHRTDGGIHTRRITTGGQNTYTFHC